MAGIEPSFGTNAFNEASYKNETETVANAILALLFGKPGYFPSMPNLGLDIQRTLYMFWDEIDAEVIKAQIIAQCKSFKQYVDDGSLDVIKTYYKKEPLLLIVIPVQIQDSTESLAIGVSKDGNGGITYNYVYAQTT
jgi:hypothetical protein